MTPFNKTKITVHWHIWRRSFFAACCGLILFTHPVYAGLDTEEPAVDLTAVAIEDLMDLTVTSVSRGEQKLYNSAAAVFVITEDDIRRSGATSVPEALRMVPGLEVARIDANKWAVSSRGFNGRFASKMLVLIDGRTVYTPLFSGVFWDAQDTLLEDVLRVEIIRGPGATLWGANAVNGIINIITKQSDDTAGGLVTAGAGTQERAFGSLRYGTQLGNNASGRAYLKYLDRGGMLDPQTGREEHNDWRALRGGFRLDAEPSDHDTLTLQGDYYDERLQETYLNPFPGVGSFDYTTPVSGANLLSRWKRTFSDGADMALQLYYDRTEMKYAVIGERRDTVDLDFQNRFALGARQEIIWGAGYRFTHGKLNFPLSAILSTDSQNDQLFSAFLQDNITLAPDRLNLIIGSKFEHNDYTGFETQPNARLLWTPTGTQTVWMSVSRAVRTPSLGEDSLSFNSPGPPVTIPPLPQPLPSQVQLTGSRALRAEELLAYELGYRVEPVPRLSFDAAAFYNVYRRLNINRQGQPVPDFTSQHPSVTIPLQLGNFGRAETCGFELATDLKALPWWRVKMAYTFMRLLHKEADPGASFSDVKGENPQHQLSLRSSMDLTREIDLDLWLRYVDELPAFGIASYLTVDTRLAWRPAKDLELSLVGQNLLHDRQKEFSPQFVNTEPAAVGRSVYGKISWRF
jgi:iron complex outermembrane recepter protein